MAPPEAALAYSQRIRKEELGIVSPAPVEMKRSITVQCFGHLWMLIPEETAAHRKRLFVELLRGVVVPLLHEKLRQTLQCFLQFYYR